MEDRPIAIKGLETRLIRTFGTVGGYGVFDCYFHRGLLWQPAERAADAKMPVRRISALRDRVPSWSWMRYEGAIKYLDVPFGDVSWDWGITSPFLSEVGEGDVVSMAHDGRDTVAIQATAFKLADPSVSYNMLDEPFWEMLQTPVCVIVGRSKRPTSDRARMHYVLLVSLVESRDGPNIFERVGVGCLQSSEIASQVPGKIYIR